MSSNASKSALPGGSLFDRRNWLRLPVLVPATINAGAPARMFAGSIVDISENGIGFLLDENLLGLDETSASFWLPFDVMRPNEAMLEPVSARFMVVSSRYHADAEIYAYSAVFVGLAAHCRRELAGFLFRAHAAERVPVA